MKITGTVSKVIESKGKFTPPGQTESIDYDHDLVTILVDGLDPVEVKIKANRRTDQTNAIERGQTVTFDVSVPKGTRLDFDRLISAPASVKSA